jgi:N-acetylneuraminate synthase
MEQFNPPCYKIPSAALTDDQLLQYTAAKGRVLIVSTGMSTMEEIRHAVSSLDQDRIVLCHATSTYPCAPAELNLRMITTLRREFDCPVGYSGHDVGLSTTYAAVVLGACLVERHITVDRAMWGTDQAASVEPWGFMRLVRDIRLTETALGDGEKRVYSSELPAMRKLRRAGASSPKDNK